MDTFLFSGQKYTWNEHIEVTHVQKLVIRILAMIHYFCCSINDYKC